MASEVYSERFTKLKEVDVEKYQIIEDLMKKVGELECDLVEKKLRLEREEQATIGFQKKHTDVLVELTGLKHKILSNRFVSVLIDGDCMPFVDDCFKSPLEGGKKAARQLESNVSAYISSDLKLSSQIHIRIHVYANFKGLASAYCYNKVIGGPEELQTFVRGFNMGGSMCDFVDAGDGKECADSKLKELFNRDLDDVQCEAVLFGGSADNGYARLLQRHVRDDLRNNNVILIEGPPFAKELEGLKDKFLVTSFPDTFRKSKLQARRVSFSTTPPATSAVSYAATISAPLENAQGTRVTKNGSSTSPPPRKTYAVLVNREGQRIDDPISVSAAHVRAARDKKLCNLYHILGECYYSDCKFTHGGRISETEIQARRVLARMSPCPGGLRCKDGRCLLGHQCPERNCVKIRNGCAFIPEMHNIDRIGAVVHEGL